MEQFPKEQLRMIGNETADFITARFLLKPGRTYEQAVTSFQPYSEIKEVYPERRNPLSRLLQPASSGRIQSRYIYVNNRFEGCAPWTILAALQMAIHSGEGQSV